MSDSSDIEILEELPPAADAEVQFIEAAEVEEIEIEVPIISSVSNLNLNPLDETWIEIFNCIFQSDEGEPEECDDEPKINKRICIFGAKGVGKSTFSKWLVNRCLQFGGQKKVLYIDLDPGQPEFTPPGLLSVRICDESVEGKNFSHLSDPIFSSYIGSVNMADCAQTYIKGVCCLLDQILKDDKLKYLTWIINTMGFSQGLGVDFSCEIIKILRPNNVIQIYIPNDKSSFPFDLDCEGVASYQAGRRGFILYPYPEDYPKDLEPYQYFKIESALNARVKESRGAVPKRLRDKLFVSYFSKMLSENDSSILSLTPYKLSLDSIAIATLNTNFTYDQILRSINGNLVALCYFPDSDLKLSSNSKRRMQTRANRIIPGERTKFFGYGIVRSIDLSEGSSAEGYIYLLTPVPSNQLLLSVSSSSATINASASTISSSSSNSIENSNCKVNCLISAGNLGLPIQLYLGETTAKITGEFQEELPYILNTRSGNSNLHSLTKKKGTYKRVSNRVLQNAFI